MIALLLALHPRAWRAVYGEELRDLLEGAPVTAAVVVDVLRNAARQHARAHGAALRLLVALLASVVVEVVAVRAGLTDNVLWPPTTRLRALALAALLLPWVPVASDLTRALRRHRTPGRLPS